MYAQYTRIEYYDLASNMYINWTNNLNIKIF